MADGTVSGLPELTEIIVTPDPATTVVGGTQQFAATGYDQYDNVMEINLVWSTNNCGTIDGNGLFTAPTAVGQCTVTATDLDTAISDSATVNVTAQVTSLSIPVAGGSDDAEEKPSGRMSLNSSDLDLTLSSSSLMTVGMRFINVAIPEGATISNAYLQFQADEAQSGQTSLIIEGEDSDHALTFTSVDGDISSRFTTTASVSWSPEPWLAAGDAGLAQQTPNIAAVIQEIVNNLNWMSGNSIVIIITGTGKRTAESYDGLASGAPTLHIEYTTAPPVLAEIIVTPNTAVLTYGGTEAFTAACLDEYNAPYAPCDPVWTATGADNTIDLNTGLFTAGTVEGLFTVTATDGLVSGNALVTVSAPPELAQIDVTPNTAVLTYGGMQTFTAACSDQYDAPFVPCDPVWTATGADNTIDPDTGLFTAGTVEGPFTVTATDGLVSGNASVTVSATPELTKIDVTPNTALVMVDGTQAFTAACSDQYDAPFVPCDPVWTATGADNTINPDTGLFTAGATPGAFEVRATDGPSGIYEAASVEVLDIVNMTIDIPVTVSSDDAEEAAGGAMSLTSSDLELVFTGTNQTVGMRFT
jgi:hypothetical protein